MPPLGSLNEIQHDLLEPPNTFGLSSNEALDFRVSKDVLMPLNVVDTMMAA